MSPNLLVKFGANLSFCVVVWRKFSPNLLNCSVKFEPNLTPYLKGAGFAKLHRI
ncbi:hypothetical protein [Campylobacter rectus]|uniref:hypothetical protein n=1 Tax=Campylobacter rectus TaxID=203 RepID=UPI0028E5FE1D|nr:hypothetical protein [Campylobacter rectus]